MQIASNMSIRCHFHEKWILVINVVLNQYGTGSAVLAVQNEKDKDVIHKKPNAGVKS